MAGAIAEVVGQVQAIAQVYGLQVGAERPLAGRELVAAIAASVQRTFGREIELRVDGGPTRRAWVLPEAESIPIALILNELLTNAVKHAAGDGRARLRARLRRRRACASPSRTRARWPPASISPRCAAASPASAWCARCCRAGMRGSRSSSPARRVVASIELLPPGVTRLAPA